jgi:hypothetical protein
MRKLLLIFLILFIATPVFATDTLTLTDYPSGKVFQRDIGGTSATIIIVFSYTGSPSGIDARVVLHGTSTVVVDWTQITTPASSPAFGYLTVPQGMGKLWYNVQIRFSTAGIPQSNGTHPWTVGILTGDIGQSNIDAGWKRASQEGTDTLTALPSVMSTTDGTTWSAPLYNASVSFGNTLSTLTNLPVGLIMNGVGASGLTYECQWPPFNTGYWLAHSGSPAIYNWTAYINAVTAASDRNQSQSPIVEGTVWEQGETEAYNGCDLTSNAYQTHLQSFFTQLRTQTGSSTKIVVASLNGCDDANGCNDLMSGTNATNIRGQQSAACTADGQALYVDMSDLALYYMHYPAADNITVGQRLATAMASLITVNGVCGSANGTSVGNVTSANACSAGTIGAITLTGLAFSWTCSGVGGGSTATCSATQVMAPVLIGASYAPVLIGASYAPVKTN